MLPEAESPKLALRSLLSTDFGDDRERVGAVDNEGPLDRRPDRSKGWKIESFRPSKSKGFTPIFSHKVRLKAGVALTHSPARYNSV